ncbi:Protein LONGIFOLIA 1 [Linum perenne]
MAAKLLHSLADDNPDLQKQIGCMTGIFQIFDRQQMVTGRRLTQKKLLPPGNFTCYKMFFAFLVLNDYCILIDMSSNKSSNEKQRISTESSRASFSSSCSSFSSLDIRTAQPETSSTDRIIFPETPSRDPVLAQPSTCSYSERHTVDLRDVVKDSMYRDGRGLSVKTLTSEGAKVSARKHKDSPRPLQFSKSADGSYGVANSKINQNVPADVQESLRVLAKLREAPWYHNETREHARPSYESKDIWSTVTKDAPRFSYDGRDANRSSFESRDTIKSTPKLKELPRLSLDSRERSMKASISDSKRNSYLERDLQKMTNSNERVYNVQQSSSGNPNRPASLVAKLMGLETLPDSELASQPGSLKTSLNDRTDSFSRSFKQTDVNVGIRIPKSPRSLMKEPVSPRRKNPDLQMKPISKLPIEPAPWKQLDGPRGAQKSTFKVAKVPVKTQNSFPSVYSEIEKRLKDLEFKQSGKDLRALKQILEAMQAKGLLETGKEEQDSKFVTQPDFDMKSATPNQRPGLPRQQNLQENLATASRTRASNSMRTYDSPIVIMKPAKLAEKSGIPPSSMIPIDGLPMLRRIQNGGYASNRQGTPASSRAVKDQSPRNSHREPVSIPGDKKTSVSRGIRSNHTSSKPQHSARESTSSSIKGTGSVSPRLQQKKLELERRSRPPTPPSDTSKPRRQSGRQPTESASPGGKYRMRAPKQPQNDDQLSQISTESRTSSYQGDDISMHSDSSTVAFDLKTDVEVTSAGLSAEKATNLSVSASMHNSVLLYSVQKETSKYEEEEVPVVELVAAPEQPSPVSVLDSSVYKDDAISPVKQIPNMLEGDGVQSSIDCQNDDQWDSSESLSNSTVSSLTSDISRKKLKNIDNLVQKLRRLNSTHDEASTDYIASLCEKNTNPDHRYISEILLASGLLLRDLGSGTAFQLHQSGHPINPELFCVLEQTKASNLQTKEENIPLETCHTRRTAEKLHRKLIFDAVNEILVAKLDLPGASPVPPRMKSGKLAKKTITAQKLLKELCSEIEQLQVVEKPECRLDEEEEDGLKAILCEDVVRRSGSWTVFDNEVSGMVLDVERLIFKDLVGEIVMGETAGLLQSKIGRRRQLFAK